MMTALIRRGALLLALGYGPAWAGVEEFPRYRVDACCELCPAAADPAQYSTSFLKSFERLVQGTGDWLFRSEIDLMTDIGLAPDGLATLRRFRDTLAARGTELVIIMQPTRGLMHPERVPASAGYDFATAKTRFAATLASLQAAGITTVPLAQLVDEGGHDSYFFPADHHWTTAGAQRTAALVAATVRGLPAYAPLPRAQFASRQLGIVGLRHTLRKAAAIVCATGPTRQYFNHIVSEPVAAEADFLSDAATTPQVVLVGTSNSEGPYNFDGYLAEYLETDVLNMASTGAGLEAMGRYLQSAEFRAAPPALLLWEVEAYHRLDDRKLYRRWRPLAQGDCTAEQAVLSQTRQLKSGTSEVLFNAGVRRLSSAEHFIAIRVSDTTLPELSLKVWYTNGKFDLVRLQQPESTATPGYFVTDLRDDPAWAGQTLLSVDLITPVALKAEVRLCAKTRPIPGRITQRE